MVAFWLTTGRADDLGGAPDYVALPVGNAGNITAYWKGFTEARESKMAKRRPVMYGFQAAGAAPIVNGEVVTDPQTIATAIRIGNPASWNGAVRARDESGGSITAVTDDEILDAYKFLAQHEGVFCEPASAAAVAGLRKLAQAGTKPKQVVCVLTGNGMKDPDRAITLGPTIEETAPTIDAVRAAIRG